MSRGGVLAGVLELDLLLAAVGYCILAAALRGRGVLTWISYAGVAFLAGTGLVLVVLGLLAVAGVHTGVVAFAIVAALLAAAGLAGAGLLPQERRVRLRPPTGATPLPSRLAAALAAAAGCAVVVICVLALVGATRAAAWLDDTWNFWLPKGRTLDLLGLDPRLFAPGSGKYLSFPNLFYPLSYPILLNLQTKVVGALDFRAFSIEDTLIVIAFVASVARLAWGRVRPWILWVGLLLLVASPGVFRQAQDGGADVPLGCFLALFVLCSVGWLVERAPFYLALAAVFAMTAVSIKREGLPQLLVFLFVLSVFAVRRDWRRVAALWVVAVVAYLTTVPWTVWRSSHHVQNEFSTTNALDPHYLSARTAQLRTAFHSLAHWAFNLHEWTPVIELVVVLALVGLVLDRRLMWLAPPLLLAAVYVFWLWVWWGYPQNLLALQPTSYRTIISLILVAFVLLPLLGERLVPLFLRARERRLQGARPAPRAPLGSEI